MDHTYRLLWYESVTTAWLLDGQKHTQRQKHDKVVHLSTGNNQYSVEHVASAKANPLSYAL